MSRAHPFLGNKKHHPCLSTFFTSDDGYIKKVMHHWQIVDVFISWLDPNCSDNKMFRTTRSIYSMQDLVWLEGRWDTLVWWSKFQYFYKLWYANYKNKMLCFSSKIWYLSSEIHWIVSFKDTFVNWAGAHPPGRVPVWLGGLWSLESVHPLDEKALPVRLGTGWQDIGVNDDPL